MGGDTISRQEAIKLFYKQKVVDKSVAVRILTQLSSVQPERAKGEWIEWYDEGAAPFFRHRFKCSVCCQSNTYGKADFCPLCGADNRKGKHDEQRSGAVHQGDVQNPSASVC